MKSKFINYFMDVALRTAELSSCTRLQVGAIIVKDDKIISIGYNGSPSGWSNCCEDKVYHNSDQWFNSVEYELMYPLIDTNGRRYKLVTKQEVLHAEENALGKLAKGNESGDGAIMFLTHAPCMHCSKIIYAAGISTVYFNTTYRITDGVDFLNKVGVITKQVS